MDDHKKNERLIVSTEDQLQVIGDCQKMLEATGCDYMICLCPTKDGREEIIKANINTKNLVGHFNSIAEQTAKRLGITRAEALTSMALDGSITERSIKLD